MARVPTIHRLAAWRLGVLVPPGVTEPAAVGTIATTTIAQGAGTVTIDTAQAFSGGGLTYSLVDDLSGYALPGMAINSGTGVITCTRANLRRGLRYLRVRASNELGSAVQRFNVFVRFEAFDYTVTTKAELDTVLANADATLSGKVIAVSGIIPETISFPAKAPAAAVTITGADHNSRLARVVFAGAGKWAFDGLIVHNSVYPLGGDAASLFRASTGTSSEVDYINCDLSHNYQGGELDPAAALPEYDKGQLDSRTATTTSTAYALVHRDPAMPDGQLTFTNNGSVVVYVAIGNSGIVATTGSTSVAAGATEKIDFAGTGPTHVAILASSGTAAVNYRSEQGLNLYMMRAFSAAGGGASMNGKVAGCYLHDLINAVKGGGAGSEGIDNNDMRRIYMDAISVSPNKDPAKVQRITRNRIGLPFGRAADAQNPHSDVIQVFHESSTTRGVNVEIAGNVVFRQAPGSGVAQIFLSDNPPGFDFVAAIGNAQLASNTNGLYIGESATGDSARDCLVWGNTIVNAANPVSPANITLVTDAKGPSYAAGNITHAVGAAMQESNVLVSDVTIDGVIADRAGLIAARDFETVFPLYDASAGVTAGAAWAWDQGAIDWTTTDQAAVINWAVVPPGIIWSAFADVVPSTVQTTPWRRVKGGGGAVVPIGGSEWQTSSDGGTTIVQDWTASTGTVARGEWIRASAAAPATFETTASFGVTINGFAVSTTITTRVATAANFVGRKVVLTTLAPQTVSLSGLTGGLASDVAEGDLVIVTYTCASNTSRSLTIGTAGYTTQSFTFANSTYDTMGRMGWKIMGAVPDTDVTLGGNAVGGTPAIVTIQVYRGIDPTTPIAAGPATATGTSGAAPNPAQLTGLAAGAQVVVAGACAYAQAVGAQTLTAPYLQSVSKGATTGTYGHSMLIGDVIVGAGGTYDPAAFTIGASAASDSWSAITLALNPAP